MGSDAIIACQCASISPGISVRPPPAITSAPAGSGLFCGSMALILWPSTTTRMPVRKVPDLPSNTRTSVNTTGPLGASGARASADFGGSTKAPTSKAALPPRKVRRFRVACRCWFRRSNTGVWHRQPNRRWVLSSSGTEGEMDGSCTATSFKDGE